MLRIVIPLLVFSLAGCGKQPQIWQQPFKEPLNKVFGV
jgi:hypothetical protein